MVRPANRVRPERCGHLPQFEPGDESDDQRRAVPGVAAIGRKGVFVTIPAYLPTARGGDLIFFGGADASDAVHLITEVVSNGIAVLTRSNLTHVAMVLEPSLPVNGRPQTSLNLIESTILAG